MEGPKALNALLDALFSTLSINPDQYFKIVMGLFETLFLAFHARSVTLMEIG